MHVLCQENSNFDECLPGRTGVAVPGGPISITLIERL